MCWGIHLSISPWRSVLMPVFICMCVCLTEEWWRRWWCWGSHGEWSFYGWFLCSGILSVCVFFIVPKQKCVSWLLIPVCVCVCGFRLKTSVSALTRLMRVSQKSKNSIPPSCRPPHLTRVTSSYKNTHVSHIFNFLFLLFIIISIGSRLFFQKRKTMLKLSPMRSRSRPTVPETSWKVSVWSFQAHFLLSGVIKVSGVWRFDLWCWQRFLKPLKINEPCAQCSVSANVHHCSLLTINIRVE